MRSRGCGSERSKGHVAAPEFSSSFLRQSAASSLAVSLLLSGFERFRPLVFPVLLKPERLSGCLDNGGDGGRSQNIPTVRSELRLRHKKGRLYG